jgi:UDP-N-acetylglucosamine transferase subunit ALG13
MKVYFLEAQQSLTKSFTLEPNGTITKSNYPKAYLFTSHEELCPTLSDFYKAVVSHAKLGHCLLKGELHAPLIKQSRANSTKTDGLTQWICLDWDKARFASPNNHSKT